MADIRSLAVVGILALTSFAAPRAFGQHAGHGESAAAMSSIVSGDLPMTRDGSGTSWHPDASPLHAIHATRGDWSLMIHGAAFVRYTHQDVFGAGTRGDGQFGVPNWFMGMVQRALGRQGRFTLRSMISLDRITEGGNGYPLLLQTGETWRNRPLVDRQHPHDFVSELALGYSHHISDRVDAFLYFGYPGEPALGPPSVMHRPAARHNPDSPIGHHWQDATHILFGVATAGLRAGTFKVDASVFTGREPDEDRFAFDEPRFDSYSARLAWNPTDELSVQVSRGFLRSPEALEPDEDQWRTTASALFHRHLSGERWWTNSLIWGFSQPTGADPDHHAEAHEDSHSILAESDLQIGRQAFYARGEWVQKSAGELVLTGQFEEGRSFSITSLTAGYARSIAEFSALSLTIGGQVMLFGVPGDLRPIYGEMPVSVQIYLLLRPPPMNMHGGSAAAPHTHH